MKPYRRIDLAQLQQIQHSERPPLHIRWWILPLALLLCAGQSALIVFMEHVSRPPFYVVSTQISIIAFGLLAILALLINPALRLAPIVQPLNRAELMAVFAAIAVSAGISTFGLVDQLIPLIVAPFNSQWNTPQRQWDQDVIPFLQKSLFITDTDIIQQYREGFNAQGSFGEKAVFLIKNIPWVAWIKPLSLWMVFGFGLYAMFYSLSTLLYDTWARCEKLVFPLAKLPLAMIHADNDAPGTIPIVFRSGLFWIGFGAVFALMSFNTACDVGWIEGLTAIKLGIDHAMLRRILSPTALDGIASGGAIYLMFMVSFTAIGIGFLLPLAISRSLWVYFVFALGALMTAIWLAFGANSNSFPTEWLWTNNFITSLAGGGLLAFSVICLVRLILAHWAEASESAADHKFSRFITGFGRGGVFFAMSTVICVAWLVWARVPIHWAIIFLAIVMLVAIGLMRAVAEGGIYWIQIHVGPFHLAKMAGAAKFIPKAALAPLMAIYSVFFLDIKTYIAPSILNSFKMQQDTRASRRMFHTVVISSIVFTVIIAAVLLLCVTYDVGADRASRWFFSGSPQSVLDKTQRLVGGNLAATGESNWVFYALGIAWVALSFAMRRRFFWWLHPIGFIMLANPMMTQLWFSFFLGGVFKKITVKHGGRHMFAKMRPFFIGLILGELLSIFIWMTAGQMFGISHMTLSLNK